MDNKDILAVVEKYRTYFDLWNADVAIGITGEKIFYVLGENHEMELFTKFETAEQLEQLILGTLAENMTVMMEGISDSLALQFHNAFEATCGKDYYTRDVTEYLSLLAKEFAMIRKELKEWSNMIEMTFKPLKALGIDFELDDEEDEDL